jgi:RNA polymerase sigma factor (sigma-70 family)
MTVMSARLNPDKVICEYTPLVHYFARQYARYGLSLDDLVQEGLLGLLEACKRYDAGRDASFETYAGYWIKKYILQAVGMEAKHSFSSQNLDETILSDQKSPPVQQLKQKLSLPPTLPDLEKTILRLSFERSRTIKEIAAELNLTPEKVRQKREKALRRLRVITPSA